MAPTNGQSEQGTAGPVSVTSNVAPERSQQHEEELAHLDVTEVPINDQEVVSTTLSSADLDSVWESMVKITLASFGGSLVGLALENQRRNHQQPHVHQQQPTQGATTGASGGQGRRRRLQPPTRRTLPPSMGASGSSIVSSRTAAASLPGQWALSCFFFAAVMEASRRTSPTGALLRAIRGIDTPSDQSSEEAVAGLGQDGGAPTLTPTSLSSYRDVFVTSLGDYALGGAAAGIAGGWALASRPSPSSSSSAPFLSTAFMGRRAGLLWGLRVGGSLGALAGLVQGAADVAYQYSAGAAARLQPVLPPVPLPDPANAADDDASVRR